MQEKQLKDIYGKGRELFERAEDALSKQNYKYAIDMYKTCLIYEPGFSFARKQLRNTVLKSIKKRSNFKTSFAEVKNFLTINKAKSALKNSDYSQTLEHLEDVLSQDPYILSVLKLLIETAEKAELVQLHLDSLDYACKFYPKDIDLNIEYSDVLLEQKQVQEALDVIKKLASHYPDDVDLKDKIRDLNARLIIFLKQQESLKNQQQEEKEEEETVEESAEARIEKYLNILNSGGDSVELRIKLGKAYLEVEDYDTAVESFGIAFDMSNGKNRQANSLLEKTVILRINIAISEWQEHAKLGDKEAEMANEQLAILQKEKDDYELQIKEKKSKLYFNDAKIRMDLGLTYYAREEYEKALIEFNVARNTRHLQFKAFKYIAFCYEHLKKYSEAERNWQKLISLMPSMDDKKAEAMHNLANLYKRADVLDSAQELYKQLHEYNSEKYPLE